MALFRRRGNARLMIEGATWRVPADLAAAVEKRFTRLKAEASRVTVELAGLRGERDALVQLLGEASSCLTAEHARAEGAERRLAAALAAQAEAEAARARSSELAQLLAEVTAERDAARAERDVAHDALGRAAKLDPVAALLGSRGIGRA